MNSAKPKGYSESKSTSSATSKAKSGWKRAVWLRGLCFLLLAALLLGGVTQLFLPKAYALTSPWPATSNAEGIYRLEKNSLDVLILGSSKAYTAVNPQVLYNEASLRAYNLGTDMQTGLVSWYWLQEALRRQNPRCLVLEASAIFPVLGYLPLEVPEAMVRKSIDPMRLSPVKLRAVLDICARDDSQSLESYLFPHIRFHERWKDLGEDDFTLPALRSYAGLMGYSALLDECEIDDYVPLREDDSEEPRAFSPVMEEYMNRIVALCADRGIELVLLCTPDPRATEGENRALRQYAAAHDLPLLDFNTARLMEEIGYDFSVDNADYEHPSLSGAEKISSCLAAFLRDELQLTGQADPQWDAAQPVYEQAWADYRLLREESAAAWLSALENDRYTLFLIPGRNPGEDLPSELLQSLPEGLSAQLPLSDPPALLVSEGGAPVAVVPHGNEFCGSFRGGVGIFRYSPAEQTLQLDDETLALPEEDGAFLLVYDTLRRMVVDKAVLHQGSLRHIVDPREPVYY